jgi:hypothetical protein
MIQLLEELSILVDNPGREENQKPLIREYYTEATPLGRLIQSGDCPLAFNCTYESLLYDAMVSFDVGRQITEVEDHKEEFKKNPQKNENQCMFRHGRLQNGEQTIRRIRIDRSK